METNESTRTHAGPSLRWLGLVYTLLFLAATAAIVVLRHGAVSIALRSLNPYGSAEAARTLFVSSPQAVRVSAFLLLASAIPLGIYAATIVSRMRFLGVHSAGPSIAFLGGLGASGALAAAALCLWVLSVPELGASLTAVRALHFLTFLCGGAFFSAGFGLMAAGVSVTSYSHRLLPPWLVWGGLLIAAVGELATLSLITVPMTFAIPITRFGGFAWLIAAGALMPERMGEPEA
jgi:hypothetical protein